MFGSMFIGLSGMNAYSNGLRQVSNNITNLNSSGYRASSIGFNDLFRGSSNGISYTQGSNGGGDGVQLSNGLLDLSQGELRQTSRDLDLAVDGNGFLVLERDGQYFYTRTGSFEVDNEGFIVLTGTDYKLAVLDDSGRAQPVSIDPYRTSPPEATTSIKFADNLSSTATEYVVPDVQVFNANGESDNWTINFNREETDPAGEWTVTVTNGNGEEIGEETLTFTAGVVDSDSQTLSFSDDDKDISVELDFSENVTSFSSGAVSTLRTSEVDGYGIGEITTISVNDDGKLEINYSNEETKDLGAVALADFREPQALEQRSGGIFVYDSATGREFLSSESERSGRVLSRRLEASNVDLSKEFGELILVQRGYQASSQVVSVSNDMIQQLFGIRGQG